MKGFENIMRIRQYLNYLENHLIYVQHAWLIVQKYCHDLEFMQDAEIVEQIQKNVENHDLSKFSIEEFIPYQQRFFPTERDVYNTSKKFDMAWTHHKQFNDHHWENWTVDGFVNGAKLKKDGKIVACVHMIVDWIAMGLGNSDAGRKDNAREFYEKSKTNITFPNWAVVLMYKIFDRVYDKNGKLKS